MIAQLLLFFFALGNWVRKKSLPIDQAWMCSMHYEEKSKKKRQNESNKLVPRKLSPSDWKERRLFSNISSKRTHRLIRCGHTSDFTHGQLAVAHGQATFLCVTDFSKVKLTRGSFQGYIKKNKRITHDSSRGKFYGSIKIQSGSTNYERKWNVPSRRNHGLFTCCVRLGAKSYSKVDSRYQNSAGFWVLLWIFFRVLR